MPTTASIRPVRPFSVWWENSRSVQQAVQSGEAVIQRANARLQELPTIGFHQVEVQLRPASVWPRGAPT